MKEICIVHLVRALNGIDPFKRFLESYRLNQGDVEHELLVLLKGFNKIEERKKYMELLRPFEFKILELSDDGFDITAYFTAAKYYSNKYKYFCFLNSFSEILDRNWLNNMYHYISMPGVGLVGATGSWQSFRGNIPTWKLPISKALRDYRNSSEINLYKKIISAIKTSITQSRYLITSYYGFPNYHIRTNAFMISSENLNKIKSKPMHTKNEAYQFESGRNGLTRQILDMDKRVIVVGKDGLGYDKEEWFKSKTFWQAEQENLLVSDNQTQKYMSETKENRRKLSTYAWGDLAK